MENYTKSLLLQIEKLEAQNRALRNDIEEMRNSYELATREQENKYRLYQKGKYSHKDK